MRGDPAPAQRGRGRERVPEPTGTSAGEDGAIVRRDARRLHEWAWYATMRGMSAGTGITTIPCAPSG